MRTKTSKLMALLLFICSGFILAHISACTVNNSLPADLSEFAQAEIIGSPLRHDPAAFTEGFLVHDKFFYESTGLEGQSSLRKVEISTGKIIAEKKLAEDEFGEGLALLDGKLYQLTYKHGLCFVYDAESFEPLNTLNYEGEGWGLTSDGKSLIMSNGSDTLFWRDPEDFSVQKTLPVSPQGKAVDSINELEYIEGYIYANRFLTDQILKIDPENGKVVTLIDASNLRPESTKSDINSVLNGIAWDSKSKQLYLTGKNWPSVFAVKIVNGGPIAKPQ